MLMIVEYDYNDLAILHNVDTGKMMFKTFQFSIQSNSTGPTFLSLYFEGKKNLVMDIYS